MQVLQRIRDTASEADGPPALVYNLKPVSYRDLYRRIMAVRRVLAGRGLKPNGTALVRVQSILVGWTIDLALRSLGLTTVALRGDGDAAVFTSLDTVALVTWADEPPGPIDAAVAPQVPRIAIKTSDWDAPDDGGPLELPPTTAPGAHIVLTSGTTGRFKMVMIEKDAEAANIQAGAERQKEAGLGTGGPRGMINLLDFGLWTINGYAASLAVWGLGATVVAHQGPDAWRSLHLPGLTHLMTTPAMLSQILAAAPADMPRNDALTIMSSGSHVSLALAREVKARLTQRIGSDLGSTEMGAWARTPLVTDEDVRWHRLVPGRVVEVVDEADKPLPPGELGQVRIKLDNQFRGYINDPDTSAEVIRDGYFYPGDLGVLDGTGRLALYGRTTEVINLQGDKVPAHPYELALQSALGVEGVCVFSEQDGYGAEQLHVVLESEPIEAGRLEQAANASLNGFPKAHFHFMPALPRTTTGKIQRFKLKQQLLARSQAGQPPGLAEP